uniref:Uncharacterized protein n=1 Tax=Timema douglasi TaxID=61478 RepID=A0A7R8VFL7_TIMDO|nr:unnamed protein product [Timema douglasi]
MNECGSCDLIPFFLFPAVLDVVAVLISVVWSVAEGGNCLGDTQFLFLHHLNCTCSSGAAVHTCEDPSCRLPSGPRYDERLWDIHMKVGP